jgi:hypothetical protein
VGIDALFREKGEEIEGEAVNPFLGVRAAGGDVSGNPGSSRGVPLRFRES